MTDKITAREKLIQYCDIYQRLLPALAAIEDARINEFRLSLETTVRQFQEMLQTEQPRTILSRMVKGVRQGLRETPRLVASLVPDRKEEVLLRIREAVGCDLESVD
jgi:hypothetical protein